MLIVGRVFGMDGGTVVGVGVVALVCAAILITFFLAIGSGDRDP